MKRLITTLALTASLAAAGAALAPPAVHAADPLPACATSGDKDGDGVPDAQDVDETDSCSASHTGFENCQTGAGDGLPDCAD